MNIDFKKSGGLVPAVIQDNETLQVLMLGYMNEEALRRTQKEKKVTFYSRSKDRLWTKGETSGNHLLVNEIRFDCDSDALLVKVTATGPVCHTGSTSCFKEDTARGFLYRLQGVIGRRIEQNDPQSYTNTLVRKGVAKVAQKVGEEAVETVIEAVAGNRDRFRYEAADMVYHLLILLRSMGLRLEDIEAELRSRHEQEGSFRPSADNNSPLR